MGGVAQEYRCRKGSTAPLQGVFQRSRRAECAFIDSYSWRSCKSSYSTRAADASPRRSANPTTLRMRTVRSSPIVSTSPAFTAWPGAFSRTPLMRTWPASISAAALVRAFTTRACHNHLSRRSRSKQHQFENRPDARSACLEQHHSTNEIVDPEKTGTTLRDHGHSAPDHALERDNFSSNRHPVLSFCLSMIFSENRYPLFRIMLSR